MLKRLRRYLVAGLLVWLPLAVTFGLLRFLIALMDKTLNLLPVAYRPEEWLPVAIPGLGVILTIVVLLFTGLKALPQEAQNSNCGSGFSRDHL